MCRYSEPNIAYTKTYGQPAKLSCHIPCIYNCVRTLSLLVLSPGLWRRWFGDLHIKLSAKLTVASVGYIFIVLIISMILIDTSLILICDVRSMCVMRACHAIYVYAVTTGQLMRPGIGKNSPVHCQF